MPRTARQISRTGYYHVIVRGVGKQILFEDQMDYRKYLSLLKKYSDEEGIVLAAYCLMSNHVHLLLKDRDEKLSEMMQKLGISYAAYFNKRYERTGHLFQNRFISVIITGEKALLNVYRYILNNPAEAGICAAKDYNWSSFGDYWNNSGFSDPQELRSLIGSEKAFGEFMNEKSKEADIQLFEHGKKNDIWALSVLHDLLDGRSGNAIKTMKREERDRYLLKLSDAGVSDRQIERVTGINRGVVQRAKKNRRGDVQRAKKKRPY